MLEVELFHYCPELACSHRDPNDPLSGWRFIGRHTIVDLPSVGDQICIARGEVFRVRGVMHLAGAPADVVAGGEGRTAAVRLMVDVLSGPEFVGPGY